jgi:5-methylcytosine-specific restriction endonuclease McrA
MGLLARLAVRFLAFLGLLFLLAAIGMSFDPEYADSAMGGVVLAVFCWIIALYVAIRPLSRSFPWASRAIKKSSRHQTRQDFVPLPGRQIHCEYCGAEWAGQSERCVTCGRPRSSFTKSGGFASPANTPTRAERTPLPQKLRYEILRRDGFTCQYCGRKPPDVDLEVDHIDPVSKGGLNDPKNLITACRECNAGKGATPILANSYVSGPRVIIQREIHQTEIVKVKCGYCGCLNPHTATACQSCGARI